MYLDPGFGGMLIQIIIALVAAGGAAIFALRKKIRALFIKRKDSSVHVVPPLKNDGTDADNIIDTLSEKNN